MTTSPDAPAGVDPARDVAAVVLTQRGMLSEDDSLQPFWRAVAAGVARSARPDVPGTSS